MSTAYGTYTVKELFGRMLSKLEIKTPDSQLYPKFLKELNIQQSKIFADAIQDSRYRNYYITPTPLTFTNNAYQFTLISDFYEFYNLYEATFKTVPDFKNNHEEFDALSKSTYWKDEIACIVKGEYLYLYKGSEVDATLSFTLYYVRKVKLLASETDKMDIPDELVAGLIDTLVTTFMDKKVPANA